MMKKEKIAGIIKEQKQIATGIFDLWVTAPTIAGGAKPGQFVSLYTEDASKLLPRPISICEVNKEDGSLRLVYRVTGANTGTEQFSRLQKGDALQLMGPLGNGFMSELPGTALLIGGGIGIPPMVELAKNRTDKNLMVSGYRDETFLQEDLEKYGECFVATEDGSVGTKGTVIDAIKAEGLKADIIYACGPTPMLLAIKEYAASAGITQCYLSLEEKMACGIGACLACVCGSKEKDEHSQVHNKRICKEGPVFSAWEVEL